MNYEEIDTKALKLVEENDISYAEAVFRVVDENSIPEAEQPVEDYKIKALRENPQIFDNKAREFMRRDPKLTYEAAVFRAVEVY